MTRRERKEARIERRMQWAASRDAKSEAGWNKAQAIAAYIPPGQPILVGHHSEDRHRRDLERIDSGMRQSVESAKMAEHHRAAAAGIEAQLESTIFSDDHDAAEQLQARIDERQASVDRMKAYNASCRKGKPDLSLLNEKEKQDILTIARVCSYQLGKHGEFPGYALSNLGACIRKDKERLAKLSHKAAMAQKAQAAGGTLVEVAGEVFGRKYMRITFAEKPERHILAELRAAGYSWGGVSWSGLAEDLPPRFQSIEQKFAETAPEFQAHIGSLATAWGMQVLDVYAKWREYSEYCRNGDQSAILSEFAEWNKPKA